MRILVLGGTRFLGCRLSSLLIEGGADVTLLHRGVSGVPVSGARTVRGDRAQPDGLDGVREFVFDVVVDLSSYFSDWTRRAVEAFRGRIGHYLYVFERRGVSRVGRAPLARDDTVRPDADVGAVR